MTDLNCNDIRELITNDLDRELTEVMHQRIQTHLSSCDSCRNEAATLQYSVEQVREIPRPETVDTSFAERTLNKLMAEHGVDNADDSAGDFDGQLELWENPTPPIVPPLRVNSN